MCHYIVGGDLKMSSPGVTHPRHATDFEVNRQYVSEALSQKLGRIYTPDLFLCSLDSEAHMVGH